MGKMGEEPLKICSRKMDKGTIQIFTAALFLTGNWYIHDVFLHL